MTTPLVSYRDLIKNSIDKEKTRKEIAGKIRSQQMNISEASRSLMCSRKTIRKLLNTENLDYESNKVPHSCPHKTPPELEEAIIRYHNKEGYGQDMIKLNMNLSISTSTINRILNENGCIRNEPKAWRKTRKTDIYKKKLRAFEKWQLDTKYLTDIPNLVGPIQQGLIPKYEYTLRDMRTGTTFLGFGWEERSVNDSITFLILCIYHMSLHGIDPHYIKIQSDNGPEITGGVQKRDIPEIEKVVKYFGCDYRYIPPSSPTYNSHVESFHGRIEYEQYSRLNDPKNFLPQMAGYQSKWNTIRKQLKTRKTPQMIAKEHGFLLPDSFFEFPLLVYDKLEHSNSIFSGGHYLPDDLITNQ
ncbi:DDE-type integrase/transposase/recombinase [Candidatus Dojkabacteria bacterium]|nr:DDE-type integrase/transposase/recombinase [Candidatus Dojkabacteria bacterium]